MTMFDIVRKAMLAGFGVQEVVNDFVQDLVKKGELSETQGAKLVREWSDKAEKTTEEVNKTISEMVKSALERMRVPSAEEIRDLNDKIQNLTARLAKLEETTGAGATQPKE